ncbi:hypothetical protein [Spirosoma gilvum]
MQYSDLLAEQVIKQFGLSRSVKYRWKELGVIPDKYFKPDFTPPKTPTKQQKSIQDYVLDIMELPIIKHSAFTHNTVNKGKIDEVLTLRRAQDDPERTRIARPNMPLLNFSPDELKKLHTQLYNLYDAIDKALTLASTQPYERSQQTLKELLRTRPELTTRQSVGSLKSAGATRWLNFMAGVRSHLPATDQDVIDAVFFELMNLMAYISFIPRIIDESELL